MNNNFSKIKKGEISLSRKKSYIADSIKNIQIYEEKNFYILHIFQELTNPNNETKIDPFLIKPLPEENEYIHIKRKLGHGGYLFKEFYPDSEDFDWVCKNDKPKDFLTLLRNTIMSRLSRFSNIHTRLSLSLDQKKIFMIIKANEEVLLKEAERKTLNKELELGIIRKKISTF